MTDEQHIISLIEDKDNKLAIYIDPIHYEPKRIEMLKHLGFNDETIEGFELNELLKQLSIFLRIHDPLNTKTLDITTPYKDVAEFLGKNLHAHKPEFISDEKTNRETQAEFKRLRKHRQRQKKTEIGE